MPVRFVPTPELRAAALPSAEGKLVLPSAKLLVAGKARTGATALHDTLVKTLEARGKFATKMPSPTVAELQLVLATGRARVGPFAAALVGAYGLVAVVRALLSTPEATLVTERSGTPKAEWVVEGDAAPSDARALPIMVPEWLDTLRSAIEAASSETRAKLVGIVAAARTGLPIAARAALARAFRNAEWAEEDAPEVLAIANPYVRAGRGLSPVRMLLACATRAETFARLYEASVSEYLFTSGLHAEIAMFLEPEAALERLVKLFETPLEKESTAYVLEVVKVIACFEDERAADAIAAAAHVARDEVAAYFTVHPRLVPRLERLAKGRGRKVDAVRAILEIVARAHAGGVATESVVTELPRCIATPPWESRVEPWPARELALVVGNRERVVPTRGVAQAATAMERWASRRRPSSTALDAEILAKRGVIEPERYFELTDEAALAATHRLATYSLEYAIARFGDRAIPVLAEILVSKPMRTHRALVEALRTPRIAEIAFRVHRDWAWMLDDPESSAMGLLPALFSSDLERRWDAERAILLLVANGQERSVLLAARHYGTDVAEETRAILARDPWQRLPPTLPPLRPVFESGTLPPLRTARGILPASAMPTVGMLLAVSDPWWAHPGISELRAVCTTESRDTFAWEVYERTAVVATVGHLGDDFCARRLDEKLLSKRSLFSIAERFAIYAALDRIDTPLARMLLLGYALGSPWPDRTAYIASLFATRAGLRGVANEIREEEFFPAIPVALALDFGPRELSVGYDDQLAVHLVDAAGARLPKMPKPTKKDDPAKVAVALAHDEAFTTDLASLRATALVWLERAMAEERSWSLARFRAGIVAHEALRRLARGLVWRASWAGRSIHVRIAEDATFADASDAAVVLPDDAVLAVAHAATIENAERDAFARSLGDYEVIQPFEQLARAAFRLTDEEAATTSLARYAGVVVATAKREKLLGARGWQESARSTTFLKKVNAGHVVLRLDAQSVHRQGETAADRLGTVTLVGPEGDLPLGRLGVVEASELVRDLEGIRLG